VVLLMLVISALLGDIGPCMEKEEEEEEETEASFFPRLVK